MLQGQEMSKPRSKIERWRWKERDGDGEREMEMERERWKESEVLKNIVRVEERDRARRG
jgi:hypothetical protein